MVEIKNCLICGKEFSTYQKSNFCSQTCYHKSRIGKIRPESHKQKNRESLLNYYKSERWINDKDRKSKKISESHLKFYNDEEMDLLKKYLNERYIRDKNTLSRHINPNISYKALNNTLNKYPELKVLYESALKFIPLRLQQYSLEEWLKFKKDFNKMNITECCEVYNLNDKTHRRISNWFSDFSPRKYKRRGETKPEKIIRELLTIMDIKFEKEKSILDKKYCIDFLVNNNLVIEVQGDYWHSNPKLFKVDNINRTQLIHAYRDNLKKTDILCSNYNFLEIWENDINNNLEKVKKLLKIIKNGRFNRKFYSTSSWK